MREMAINFSSPVEAGVRLTLHARCKIAWAPAFAGEARLGCWERT